MNEILFENVIRASVMADRPAARLNVPVVQMQGGDAVGAVDHKVASRDHFTDKPVVECHPADHKVGDAPWKERKHKGT